MKRINDKNFFKTNTISLAQNLIGKWIVSNIDGKEVRGQITETEAYLGEEDSACHTYKGKRTSRTEPMWQEGGTIYVYLCYGMHHLFNIASKDAGQPEAVLIRSLAQANGPAKATKFLNIDKRLNGQSIVGNPNIHIADDGKTYEFTPTTRVGIDYALERDKNALLRFTLKQ